ncbi:MAG: Na+/H+ antiporter subunit E [Candidatus Thermoplasmatota archaeon]
MKEIDEKNGRSFPDRHYVLLDTLLLIFWLLLTGIIFTIFTKGLRGLTLYSLIVGLVAVSLVSYLSHTFILQGEKKQSFSGRKYLSKIRGWSFLLAHLSFHLLISSLSLVRQTFTGNIEPKIVNIPVNLKSDSELTLLTSMITITPGTLVLKTTETDEGYILSTHFSYLRSEEIEDEIERTIKRWERTIRGLFK